ncbi:MAG TPA: hypothetical protein DCP55_04375 [Chitinophagaceae bacterium]|nr:hypothetical protein [Chitinophagaceae bacterium]
MIHNFQGKSETIKSLFSEYINKNRWILVCGLAFYLLTAWFNVGIIASDDYEFGIARIVPAQNWTALEIINISGIRSPIPNLVLYAFTKLAYCLGIVDPVTQLRVALLFVGFFSYSVYSILCFLFFRQDKGKSTVAIFLLSFYFLAPMIFTRPLIENLSAPFLLVSCWAACEYFKTIKIGDLLLSLIALSFACMFRFQVSVCALVLVVIVVLKRKWKHLLILGLAGVFSIFLTGVLDWIYKGGLHASFLAYTKYQAGNIQRFGAQPVYVFVALFLGLSMPPLLFQRYHDFSWRRSFGHLIPALMFLSVFVISHSVVVHKEERFMVPVLPIFFILVTPLALYTWRNSRLRRNIFLVLNFLLLPLASFNAPQTNLIESARFVAANPQFQVVTGVGGTLFNFPEAFIPRKVEIVQVSEESFKNRNDVACGEIVLVRKDIRETIERFNQLNFLGSAEPGLLEQLVIYLNPKQNKRRSRIEFYSNPSCL